MDSTLTEHDRRFEQRFQAQEKALAVAVDNTRLEFHEHLIQYRREVDAAFASSEKAIDKADVANEKRFDSVNEFRGQLKDQANTLMPRIEYEAAHQRVLEQLRDLTERGVILANRLTAFEANLGGRSGGIAESARVVYAILTLVSLVGAALVGHLWK